MPAIHLWLIAEPRFPDAKLYAVRAPSLQGMVSGLTDKQPSLIQIGRGLTMLVGASDCGPGERSRTWMRRGSRCGADRGLGTHLGTRPPSRRSTPNGRLWVAAISRFLSELRCKSVHVHFVVLVVRPRSDGAFNHLTHSVDRFAFPDADAESVIVGSRVDWQRNVGRKASFEWPWPRLPESLRGREFGG